VDAALEPDADFAASGAVAGGGGETEVGDGTELFGLEGVVVRCPGVTGCDVLEEFVCKVSRDIRKGGRGDVPRTVMSVGPLVPAAKESGTEEGSAKAGERSSMSGTSGKRASTRGGSCWRESWLSA
jgi:hypothetical protein